jgi:ABC-type tungstate transport system permease subunit
MIKKILCSFVFIILTQEALAVDDTRLISSKPKEIYGQYKKNIQLRIGNGGAGPTGILRALSEDYLQVSGKKFAIAWYQDISINTLQQLKKGKIDIALVYEKTQGEEATKEGWATRSTPIFNDHFLIVGPKSNPAKLDKSDSIQNIFLKIAKTGEKISKPVFLSRDDNSGTNVKEHLLWQSIDLKPWKGNSIWYFRYPTFPKDALIYSNQNQLYSITDWGTWLSNKDQTSHLDIYSQGGKSLLNHCFALLEKNPSKEAVEFLEYLKSSRAQKLIGDFGKDTFNGKALFTPAQQLDF